MASGLNLENQLELQDRFELFDLLPDAILIVDQRGVIRYANRQAGKLFGEAPATLVSAQVESLVPEQFRERHITHRAKYSLDAHMRPMGAGLDLFGRRADGTTFPADIMLKPLKHLAEPMVLAVVRDVTDRRATEEVLRKSRMMFEKFYEQSPDAIIAMDENGKINRVNAPAEALFGFPRERMLGQALEMLIPERLRDRHVAHRTRYMEDPRSRPMGIGLPLSGLHADGHEFPIDVSLRPIEIDQRQVVLAVVRDITERKRAEAQVQLLLRELRHRVKNILSVVSAMARQMTANSVQEFISRFSERIQGLSLSLDLLIKRQWQNVLLPDLVRTQLAHFGDLLGNRITMSGPNVAITAAAAEIIGMAIHELATNAGKYGALSTDMGRIDIVWRLEPTDIGGRRFAMQWSESGGPIVTAPTQHGFGWRVLCEMTKMSFGADVRLDYEPTGVIWHLGCPGERICECDALK